MQDVRSVVKYNFLRIDTMCLRAKLTVVLLSFVMSFAEIFFYGLDSSVPSLAAVVMQCASLLLFVYNDLIGASIYILIWYALYFTQFYGLGSSIFIGLIMIAFLGYVAPLVSLLACIIGFFVYSLLLMNLYAIISFVVLLFFFIVGYMVRLQKDYYSINKHLAEQKYRESVASELHDTVCNDLSYVIRLIDIGTVSNRSELRVPVEEALLCTREAIDALHCESTSCDTRVDSEVNISSIVREQQSRLDRNGINGVVMVPESFTIVTTAERAQVIRGFIREIFGNIVRHADPQCGYVLAVGIKSYALNLSVSDTPYESVPIPVDDLRNRSHSSGRGLNFYESAFKLLGGYVHVYGDRECWNLEASLPLDDRPRSRSSVWRRGHGRDRNDAIGVGGNTCDKASLLSACGERIQNHIRRSRDS